LQVTSLLNDLANLFSIFIFLIYFHLTLGLQEFKDARDPRSYEYYAQGVLLELSLFP